MLPTFNFLLESSLNIFMLPFLSKVEIRAFFFNKKLKFLVDLGHQLLSVEYWSSCFEIKCFWISLLTDVYVALGCLMQKPKDQTFTDIIYDTFLSLKSSSILKFEWIKYTSLEAKKATSKNVLPFFLETVLFSSSYFGKSSLKEIKMKPSPGTSHLSKENVNVADYLLFKAVGF